ncbi:tRNA-splicing endonuclease subunit [Lithohypha guttulata]|nr:tRNA-splicing endonuclease subunit [Lithohypha guttulata]
MAPRAPHLPIAVSEIGGTLPQNPSQNVFMGLPMEIMPEEAQLLIEKGLAYILDDVKAHDAALVRTNKERQKQYKEEIVAQSAEIAQAKAKEKETDKKRAMKKAGVRVAAQSVLQSETPQEPLRVDDAATDSFFDLGEARLPMMSPASNGNDLATQTSTLTITPATSNTLLSSLYCTSTPLDTTPLSTNYAAHVFHRHLLSLPNRTFFTTPGLRFGCQFCIYPGDPLRFHSHFLGVGVNWDEDLDLMDIVGGGRLGTGVKKGWLFGGEDPNSMDGDGKGTMRSFSVEWAGM